MSKVGAGIALWLAGYAVLIGIGLAVDFGGGADSATIVGLVVLAAYGFLLGWTAPRWPVVAVPIVAAAIFGALKSIGYDGEDDLTMLIVIAEIYIGAPTVLFCCGAIVLRKPG